VSLDWDSVDDARQNVSARLERHHFRTDGRDEARYIGNPKFLAKSGLIPLNHFHSGADM